MTGRLHIWLLLVLLLVGILLRQPLLFVVCLALLLAAGATWLWQRYCLSAVEYRRHFNQRRLNFGEEIVLTVEIVNRKPLPLAWLIVEDELPRELAPAIVNVTPSYKPGRSTLTNLLSLRWYERVRRHYRWLADQRGEFAFGPARLTSGDLFGFTSRERDETTIDLVLVYPRIVPISRLGLPAHDPFGDRATRQWLFEDPLRTVGVRDYRPGDSPRRIHWGATARTQSLQVKLYEPTITYRLAIMLNLHTVGAAWWWPSYLPELLELAIMVAASLASWAVEQGYQVGLAANGNVHLSEGHVRLAPSRSPDQLAQILELLARLTPIATLPMPELLGSQARTLPHGATVVVISAQLDEAILAELLAMQRRGHTVALVLIGETPPPVGLSLRIYNLGGVASWRELSALSLE